MISQSRKMFQTRKTSIHLTTVSKPFYPTRISVLKDFTGCLKKEALACSTSTARHGVFLLTNLIFKLRAVLTKLCRVVCPRGKVTPELPVAECIWEPMLPPPAPEPLPGAALLRRQWRTWSGITSRRISSCSGDRPSQTQSENTLG